MPGLLGAVAIVLVLLLSGLKVLREYERAVVFRLGRLVGARGPGIVYVIPGIEKALRIDLRTITMEIPSQDVITRDNVSLKVNAVLYFRVIDANRAVVEVENYSSPRPRMPRPRCAACAARRSSTSSSPIGRRSTRTCSRSSTSTPSRGASRWCRWRSSSSTCPRRCDG